MDMQYTKFVNYFTLRSSKEWFWTRRTMRVNGIMGRGSDIEKERGRGRGEI
jgi:hypothetical protein